MDRFKSAAPAGFSGPTTLAPNDARNEDWQQLNRNWWEQHPMRYDWNEPIPYPEFSREFYAEIDKRFFKAVSLYAPWKRIPFDSFIDFDSLGTSDVLEIGCGNGSHGQLLAAHAKSYTGIDLTDYAIKSTSTRLDLRGLRGQVLKMDAENLQFADCSFDFVWSWGVIHHSANTKGILREMKRVLRPNGRAIVMVYYRSLWSYYAMGALLAMKRGSLPTFRAIHECKQLGTDGALARFYKPREWRRLVSGLFGLTSVRIFGQKEALVFLPGGKLKNAVLGMIPNPLSRFLSSRCRMGSFLVSELSRL